MNTSRPTPFTHPAAPVPFHSSSRTAISENTLPTGERVRVMETSRLEMTWRAGELVLRCQASRVMLPTAGQARRTRGAL